MSNNKWYINGLCFECQRCGQCCSGPTQGFIWVTYHEIRFIADFLEMPVKELRRKYLKRIGFRTSIIEQPVTNDCIFLQKIAGLKQCVIYPVRPTQCRTWPFWESNLTTPDSWNAAVRKCPGINNGKSYTADEIDSIKNSEKWWQND